MSGKQVRYPAVAGQFYAGTKSALLKQIEDCYLHRLGPGRVPKLKDDGKRFVKGAVLPHAGYEYSGPIAAHVFDALAEDGFPDIFVMIGGHQNLYDETVITTETFVTPLGEIPVDKNLAEKMDMEENSDVHAREWAIEVQLPFLQHLKSEIKFVPIYAPMDVERAKIAGKKIAEAIKGEDVVILASSDFTHAGSNYDQLPPKGMRVDEFVRKQDELAIRAILELSPTKLFKEVEENEISMCGCGSVAAMLFALEKRAKSAELLKYATSYEILPSSSAVGYGAIIVK